jgi:hypothetical protein
MITPKAPLTLIAIVLTLSARGADTDPETALLGAVPSEVQPPAGQVARELLEAVCPGQVALSPLGCNDSDRTPESGSVLRPRSIVGILPGHFLSAESDDVLVSAKRSEGHIDRYGGTLLMTRQAGVWKPLWYHSGTITNRCMKIRAASGRDMPVCESAYIMGGHLTHDLYAIDVLPAGANEQILLSTDTFSWPNWAQKETLDSVRLLARGGSPVVEARVHYFRSDNAAGDDLSDVLQKVGAARTIDFLLRGEMFIVAPGSAAFFKTFSALPN